ncbi:hypothetical protein B0H14DRAFT_3683655 [Mycena olivaceomarginata]|nr:hypothetical protein B0H14DRAFT_3683655 [Mycena olivaceomarginata]
MFTTQGSRLSEYYASTLMKSNRLRERLKTENQAGPISTFQIKHTRCVRAKRVGAIGSTTCNGGMIHEERGSWNHGATGTANSVWRINTWVISTFSTVYEQYTGRPSAREQETLRSRNARSESHAYVSETEISRGGEQTDSPDVSVSWCAWGGVLSHEDELTPELEMRQSNTWCTITHPSPASCLGNKMIEYSQNYILDKHKLFTETLSQISTLQVYAAAGEGGRMQAAAVRVSKLAPRARKSSPMHSWGVRITWTPHPPLPGTRTVRAYKVVSTQRESRGQSRHVRSTRKSQCGAKVKLNAWQETQSVSHTQVYANTKYEAGQQRVAQYAPGNTGAGALHEAELDIAWIKPSSNETERWSSKAQEAWRVSGPGVVTLHPVINALGILEAAHAFKAVCSGVEGNGASIPQHERGSMQTRHGERQGESRPGYKVGKLRREPCRIWAGTWSVSTELGITKAQTRGYSAARCTRVAQLTPSRLVRAKKRAAREERSAQLRDTPQPLQAHREHEQEARTEDQPDSDPIVRVERSKRSSHDRAQAELYVLYGACMRPSIAHEFEHGALHEHHPESHPSFKWRLSPAHAQRIRTAGARNAEPSRIDVDEQGAQARKRAVARDEAAPEQQSRHTIPKDCWCIRLAWRVVRDGAAIGSTSRYNADPDSIVSSACRKRTGKDWCSGVMAGQQAQVAGIENICKQRGARRMYNELNTNTVARNARPHGALQVEALQTRGNAKHRTCHTRPSEMNAEAPVAGKKSKGRARGGVEPQNAGTRSERSSRAQQSKVASCRVLTQKDPAGGTQAQNSEFTLE